MKKFYVLHLDDSKMFTSLFKQIIKSEKKINYRSINDPNKLILSLEKKIPDLLILDLMLDSDNNPEIGVNLIKEIKNNEKFSKLKIVAMTTNLEKGPEKELKGLVVDFIRKDFAPSRITTRIMKLLEIKNGR
jgi:CheY-like chemotaxis protein